MESRRLKVLICGSDEAASPLPSAGNGFIPPLSNNRSFPSRRGRPLAVHGHAVGSIRYRALSPAGAPHDEATVSDGPRMLACPFRAYSFWGTVFPWRCHGLKEKCPLRGARSPIIHKTHVSGIIPNLNDNQSASAPKGQATRSPWPRRGSDPL